MRLRILTIRTEFKQAVSACAIDLIYSFQSAIEIIRSSGASIQMHRGLSGCAFGGLEGANCAPRVRINEYETRRLSGGQISKIGPSHPVGPLGSIVGVAQ